MYRLWLKYWTKFPLIGYSLLIIYLSHKTHVGIPLGIGDKTIHFWEYTIYALLALLFFVENKNRYLLSFLLSVIFAASDELHQYFIPGRHCDLFDFLIDVAGAASALLFFASIIKIRDFIQKQSV